MFGALSEEFGAAASQARRHVVQHFRQRRAPRFFVDVRDAAEAARRLQAERPQWVRATLDRARQDRDVGLKCYSMIGAKLHAVFLTPPARGPGNDVLYAVRLHRFAFAPRLALAGLYGTPTTDSLRTALENWVAATRGWQAGDAYLSTFVVACRAIALTWTLVFLVAQEGDDADADLAFLLLKVILADARFLADELGASVANNHLLTDGFTLWYLGTLFPEFADADAWRMAGEGVWLRELRRQIYADGTSFEHSVHYHALACEMAAAYLLLRRKNGTEVPEWVEPHVERMLHFQAYLGGPDGAAPAVGDATDDGLFPIDGDESGSSVPLRELYRSLFDPGLPPSSLQHLGGERAFWLLGGALAPERPATAAPVDWLAYPEGGFDLFLEGGDRTRLVFRTGPAPHVDVWGGHMHADLLSLYLTLEECPVIVDAGTYTYRSLGAAWPAGTPAWRAHFLGPRAHNGPSIDGEDPLGSADEDFRPRTALSRVARSVSRRGQSLSWVEGRVTGPTGYGGYRRGVVHVRSRLWLSYDVPTASVPRERLSIGFQLVAGATVDLSDGRSVHVKTGQVGLWVAVSEGLTHPRLVSGSRAPLGGWVAPRYGEALEAPRLDYDVQDRSTPSVTILWPDRGDVGSVSVESVSLAAGGVAVRVTRNAEVHYVFLRGEPQGPSMEAWGIRFAGSLLWATSRAGAPVAISWLDGELADWGPFGIRLEARSRVPDVEVRMAEGRAQVRGASAGAVVVTWRSARD